MYFVIWPFLYHTEGVTGEMLIQIKTCKKDCAFCLKPDCNFRWYSVDVTDIVWDVNPDESIIISFLNIIGLDGLFNLQKFFLSCFSSSIWAAWRPLTFWISFCRWIQTQGNLAHFLKIFNSQRLASFKVLAMDVFYAFKLWVPFLVEMFTFLLVCSLVGMMHDRLFSMRGCFCNIVWQTPPSLWFLPFGIKMFILLLSSLLPFNTCGLLLLEMSSSLVLSPFCRWYGTPLVSHSRVPYVRLWENDTGKMQRSLA